MYPIFLINLLSPFLFNKNIKNFSFITDKLKIIDLTNEADKDIRKYKRNIEKIKGVVIHQTSFNWKDDNPNWKKVNSHFAITKNGEVLVIHDPIWRLSISSGNANEHYIAIEHEGNYKSIRNMCYNAEELGCDPKPSDAQIVASRQLIKNLQKSYPNFKEITAHIQWQNGKTNCPGPQLWYNIGEWSKQNLKLSDNENWHHIRGKSIPDLWRDPKYLINVAGEELS